MNKSNTAGDTIMTNRASTSASGRTAPGRMSLASQGSRAQFGVAIALISVIPLLTLSYMLQSRSSGASLSVGMTWTVGAVLTCSVILGYALLVKYPRTVIRLRKHMEKIARGELPDSIDLLNGESDVSAIEEYFNLIIARMKKRIATIEEQGKQLVEVERQRVMTESLCTACHCLGQPATTIECYLELLKTESLSSVGGEHLAHCIDESGKMREILVELQSITEYRTEPYCDMQEAQPEATPAIIPTRHDMAAVQPPAKGQAATRPANPLNLGALLGGPVMHEVGV
jgi:methyl-accepting chemotaxis protein